MRYSVIQGSCCGCSRGLFWRVCLQDVQFLSLALADLKERTPDGAHLAEGGLIALVCNSSVVESRYYFVFGLEGSYDPTEAFGLSHDGTRSDKFSPLELVAHIE